MDLGIAGRAYAVTGGSRGLGFATAEALVAEGAGVVISGRDEDVLGAAVARLGDRAAGVAADNADEDTADRLVTAALAAHGRLDGVVISVGGPPAGTFLDTPEEAWRSSFESVFLGAIRIARRAVDALSPDGVIALILSSSVKTPLANLAVSNGLRPGLAMVTKTLADEIGPRGMRAFSLLPGRIDTERLRAVRPSGGEEAIPLRRYGKPEEFGRVAAFLVSPAASYVTGCVIPVDGGLIRTL